MEKFEKTTFFMDKIYCYQQDIERIVASVVGDDGIVEDITQNVLEKAWKGLDSLRNRDAPLPWIKGIIRNEIRSYFRKKQGNKEHIESDQNIELIIDGCHSSFDGDVLLELLEKDSWEYVLRALDMLDYRSKEIVTLHLIVELSLKQTAEDLHLNYGSTRVVYSRAIKKLRKFYFEIEDGATQR